MKLLIDIPEWLYQDVQEYLHPSSLDKAIMNGVLLDDMKAKIEDNAVKDVNGEGFIFLGRLLRILDNTDESIQQGGTQ